MHSFVVYFEEGSPSRNWADIVSPPRVRPSAGSSSFQDQPSSWKDVVAPAAVAPKQPAPLFKQWAHMHSSAQRFMPPRPPNFPPGLYPQTTKEELPYDRVTLKLRTGRSVSKRVVSKLEAQRKSPLNTKELSQFYEKSRKDDSPERERYSAKKSVKKYLVI